jgi:hypothetical protein
MIITVFIIGFSIRVLNKTEDINEQKIISNDEKQQKLLEIENTLSYNNFVYDAEYSYDTYNIAVDKQHTQLAIIDFKNIWFQLLPFKDIIACEIVINNQVIENSSAGNALVGGLLFGVTGAVIGASSKQSQNIVDDLYIRITTADVLNPMIRIQLIEKIVEYNSEAWKVANDFAENILSTMNSIIANNHQTNKLNDTANKPKNSEFNIDEIEEKIMKLKMLLDKNIITQGEFDNKKKELLDKILM